MAVNIPEGEVENQTSIPARSSPVNPLLPSTLARGQGDGGKDARKACLGRFTVPTRLAVNIPAREVEHQIGEQ